MPKKGRLNATTATPVSRSSPRVIQPSVIPNDECPVSAGDDRPVRTASSEQVRRPIYRDGVDQWRQFDPWLDPLKSALGEVLEAYPEAPADLR